MKIDNSLNVVLIDRSVINDVQFATNVFYVTDKLAIDSLGKYDDDALRLLFFCITLYYLWHDFINCEVNVDEKYHTTVGQLINIKNINYPKECFVKIRAIKSVNIIDLHFSRKHAKWLERLNKLLLIQP